MRCSDNFRRRVIFEVRHEPAIWDLTHPLSNSYGARSYSWQTIAFKMGVADNALDLRRMWRGWLKAFLKYTFCESHRQPKYYLDMHFLQACSADHLLSLKYRF